MIPENVELLKSKVYTNPTNDTDALPLVYGDLTDGGVGIWKCPCIDTVNFVYAYAGHETLTVANGNSINIYVDGVLASPQPTFNAANNYESQGVISTLTFASAQTGDVSARGKGKPTASGGATLMRNPVDIVVDVLDYVGYTIANIDITAKSKARDNAESNSYIAAGVVTQDVKTWELIQSILNTFNTPRTQAYIDGNGFLTFGIDTGAFTPGAEYIVIPRQELEFISAEQRIDDIINIIKGRYRYNYVHDSYYSVTSEVADNLSRNMYGDRSQAYSFPWCRNSGNVTTAIGYILDEFKQPRWLVRARDITMKRLNIDIGDPVVASILDLYDENGNQLKNEWWIVMAYNPGDAWVDLTLLDTGQYLRAPAKYDGTYIYNGTIIYGGDRDTTEY